MPVDLENPAVVTGLERVSFHSNRKERQCQRMFKLPHNCTHLTRYLKKEMAPTPVLLPGKFHGRRSLMGCSPWAAVTKSWTQLSDFTFTFHFHALEKEMATHSGESGGLPSLGLHRVRHDGSNLVAAAAHAIKVMLKILQARLQQ